MSSMAEAASVIANRDSVPSWANDLDGSVVAPHRSTDSEAPTSVTVTVQEITTSRERSETSFQGFVRSASKVLAAGLYLLDWVTSILVLRDYYLLYKYGRFNDAPLPLRVHAIVVPFAISVATMVVVHIATLVAFKLYLPVEERPILTGLFLPLMQLRRLVVALWATGTCRSQPESIEVESLYAIMAAAMETAPQLSIQFTTIVGISSLLRTWNAPAILLISLVASFLSGSYNTGRAVMYHSSMRWTFTLNAAGAAAGVYTFGTLLLRCTVVASMVLARQVWGPKSFTIVLIYFGLVLCPVSYVNAVISLGKTVNRGTIAGQLRTLVACWISINLGPLYPVVSAYAKQSKLPMNCVRYYYRMPLVLFINLSLDIACVIVLMSWRWDPCNGRTRGLEQFKHFSSFLTCSRFVSFVATGAFTSFVASIAFCFLYIASNSRKAAVIDETSPQLQAQESGFET